MTLFVRDHFSARLAAFQGVQADDRYHGHGGGHGQTGRGYNGYRGHGGYGYSKEYEIERLYREAPMLLIGEGTADIQKLIIGRRLLEIGCASGWLLKHAAERGWQATGVELSSAAVAHARSPVRSRACRRCPRRRARRRRTRSRG